MRVKTRIKTRRTANRTTMCVTAAALGVALLPMAGAYGQDSPVPTSDQAGTAAAAPIATGPTRAELKRIRAIALRARIVALAKSKLRTGQYVAGAASENSFDCSGLTLVLYKKLGINLPHYSGAQMRVAKRVSKKNLLPGDLLFYGPGGSQHVSIYIGRGKMIGASNPRADVRRDSINAPWWRNIYAGAGRVIQG